MDKQAALNRVWKHYITDGEPFSWDEHTKSCVYYNPETGARCAIGVLLGDTVHKVIDLCGNGVDILGLLEEDIVLSTLGVERDYADDWDDDRGDTPFLQKLQDAHDYVAGWDGVATPEARRRFEERLRSLARNFELEVPA